jgi:uncharacterized protein (DUF111 family)
MKLAYFDGPSGAAGDMSVSALVDAGAPFEALGARLDQLHVPGFTLERRVHGTTIEEVHFHDVGAGTSRPGVVVTALCEPARLDGRGVTVTPEFGEVRRIARDTGLTAREAVDQARAEGRQLVR